MEKDKPGLTFRYLDGREEYIRYAHPREERRWRPPVPVGKLTEDPNFYQIPYRRMVPGKYENLLAAGRIIDADKGAFGAIRVMVNTNRTGEAAGTAAWLALDSSQAVD